MGIKHQQLMDRAYEKENNLSYKDFLYQCTEQERKAVILGHLNYQVGNGGFNQWVDNGYGVYINEVIDILKDDVKTETAFKLVDILTQLERYIDTSKDTQGCLCDYWTKEDREPKIESCDECDGDGYIYSEEDDENGDVYEEKHKCEYCNGSGEVENECDWDHPGIELAGQLDNAYYDLMDQLLIEYEQYFNGETSQQINKRYKYEEKPQEDGTKFPNIKVKLVGMDGNAFSIMGRVTSALRRGKVSSELCNQFREEAMQGDYNNVLCTCMKWVSIS